MPTRIESRVDKLGSHVEGMQKTLTIMEQDRQEDRNRVDLMVAHHEELHRKLESLIDLLSAQHMKGDDRKGHDANGPSCVEERESEMEDRGLWSTIPSRQMR